ncbi:putative signal-transduction protein containing cAMP-binding and CBS domains [Pyrobaculum oguniense TE7]|uniref:Signal-transduction protein containing cAMP-binding and CBS domains n=1 Tax=Pyrobaculum oguniense (strain DSM 13380 / JCM 10595 / TE7) TaxID=698757 RepID=H6Q7K1_PYROT|nr:putative signal-transduction protein containing cAMP-binding and CBS domains [Pyrobaculum oguniense TE7]
MKAEVVARKPPITATPDARIKDVAKIMAERKIGLVVIVDKNQPDYAVGVVSERDIVKAVANNVDLNRPVKEIMTSPVITVEGSEPVWTVARIMRQHNIRHVVVTRGGKLYGVISIRDLVGEESVLRSLIEYGEPEEHRPSAD